MPLAVCSDLSPADWLVASEVPWNQLALFGPSGFAAYARLRFLPDPAYEGQSENDADTRLAPDAAAQWRALFDVLAAHTDTPDDCYFCLWEGYPDLEMLWPGQPKVTIPNRAYFLFRGPLSAVADWDASEIWPNSAPNYEPAFVWPADHAWCVASDVDPHWAGVGASIPLAQQLISDPRVDAVVADLDAEQRFYR